MKLLIGLLLIITTVAGWLYVDKDARRQWLADTPLAPAPSETTVYKWRDAQGNWQITDAPPADGIDYERLKYQSDTNVMPLVPKDKLEEQRD